jgi:hypothetical protein
MTVAEQFVEENVSPDIPPLADIATDLEPSELWATVTLWEPIVTHVSLGLIVTGTVNDFDEPSIVIENVPVPHVEPVELELFAYARVAVTVDLLLTVSLVLDHVMRACMYLLPVEPVK